MRRCVGFVPWGLALVVGGNACSELICREATVIRLTGGSGGSVQVDLDIPSYVTAERVDVRVDWGSLDADLYCDALVPAEEIGMVSLLASGNLSPDELILTLAGNALHQGDISGYVDCQPTEGTSCWLSEFGYLGTAFDVAEWYADESGTWLLQFSEGTEPGEGIRSWALLDPDPASDVTELILVPTCPMVEVSVDLDGEDATTISGRMADPSPRARSGEDCHVAAVSWPIDWSGLVTTSTGHEADADEVDLLVVARYDMAVEALEQSFTQRDALAAERYTLTVQEQTSADLADTQTQAGVPFSGFDGQGFWLLELRDTDATLNVPFYVSVVEDS